MTNTEGRCTPLLSRAEVEAVKIDPATMAIVWRYTPSPHWDEWSEPIPLVELVSRGLVLKPGKTGKHYLVVQKEEAIAAAAAAAAPPPVENPLSLPSAPTADDSQPASETHEEETADFADSGVDAACSLQLEALAVARTTGMCHTTATLTGNTSCTHALYACILREAYDDSKQSTQTCSERRNADRYSYWPLAI